ncbi:hypothetical protein CKAH01_07112 [Colletotrichum kahawae]|uniref:Uncharacterized protein n=1 Tax=Colletotrichum kahawae TaxID=34407 RepID=A0AAE0D3W5_COLKA|nr:hypothetical protein CKAH01_07112 [Colletotrichum kahawae]
MDSDEKRRHSWNGRLHVPDRDPMPRDSRPTSKTTALSHGSSGASTASISLFWLAATSLSAGLSSAPEDAELSAVTKPVTVISHGNSIIISLSVLSNHRFWLPTTAPLCFKEDRSSIIAKTPRQ